MHKKNIPAFIMAMVGIVGGFMVYMSSSDSSGSGGSGSGKKSEAKIVPPFTLAPTSIPVDYQIAVNTYFDRLKEVNSNLSFFRLYDHMDLAGLQEEYRWFAPRADLQPFQQFEEDGQTIFFSFDQDIYIISTKGALADLRNVLGEIIFMYIRDPKDRTSDFELVLRTVLKAFYSGQMQADSKMPYFHSDEISTMRSLNFVTYHTNKSENYAKIFESYVKSDQSTALTGMISNMVDEILGNVQASQAELLLKGMHLLEGDDLEIGYRNFTGAWYTDGKLTNPDKMNKLIGVPENLRALWSTVDQSAIETNTVLFGGIAEDHKLDGVGDGIDGVEGIDTFIRDGLVGERDDAFKEDLIELDKD